MTAASLRPRTLDNDTKMTFTCYVRKDLPPGSENLAKVMGIDLATGKVTDFSKPRHLQRMRRHLSRRQVRSR